MDIIAVLIAVLGLLGMIARIPYSRTARGSSFFDAFAAGFLPYRAPGWPRGVQEEEPVPWDWSPPAGQGEQSGGGRMRLAGRGPDGDEQPEVLDIDRADMPDPPALDPVRVIRNGRRAR